MRKHINFLTLILVVIILTLFVSCQKKASEEVGPGKITGNIYQNDYFGMSITFPKEWVILDKAQMDSVMKLGEGQSKENYSDLQKKDMENRSVYMLFLFRHSLLSPVPFNSNFLSLAERVKTFNNIKTGGDYLKIIIDPISAMPENTVSPISKTLINGVEFYTARTLNKTVEMSISQKMYCIVKKGYAIFFALSYVDENEGIELEKIMNSIKFNI